MRTISKRKTHDEYVKELAEKNSSIEPLEQYIDAKTKILHRCKIDGYTWYICPNKTLMNRGCPKCGNHINKDTFSYKNELSNINPNIEVIDEYENVNIPILHHCLLHNIYWKIRPADALKGHGCYKCKSEKISMRLKRPEYEYIKLLKQKNPNIILCENYINTVTPVLHYCITHDIYWKVRPSTVLQGGGCHLCGINKLKDKIKSNDVYIDQLYSINPNIIPMDTYQGANISIKHKCLLDDYQWNVKPANLLSGKGCPKCAKNNRWTHEEYISSINNLYKNIKVIGTYKNMNTPILHECTKHHHIWYARPADILRGKGCKKCKSSHGEHLIQLYLEQNNIPYEIQKTFDGCKDKQFLPFDFYLPTCNTCIEYDGIQHFQPVEFFGGVDSFKYQQYHDKLKDEYCQKNGISLLRIPYYKNIEEELNNFLFN